MADISHLEKLGKELKCPICLGLLKEAVSLTCNHVFCNLCILKSMKFGSNCPVCKVPYGRREVRPAPNMDNLVNIYKSMEIASGINILVTQNGAPVKISGVMDPVDILIQTFIFEKIIRHRKRVQQVGNQIIEFLSQNPPPSLRTKRVPVHTSILTDEENQAPCDLNHCGQETGRTCHEIAENQKRLRAKGANPFKPSFSTKKWVQVSQYLPPETPTQPKIFETETCEITRDEQKNSSISLNEQMKNGEPVFSPSFYDLMDSSDGMFSEVTPKKGQHIHDEEVFDSETFEWTQRACSPELFSTPTKIQVEDTYEALVNDKEVATQVGNTSQECIDGEKNSVYLGDRISSVDVLLPNLTSARTPNVGDQHCIKKSKGRGEKLIKKTKKTLGKYKPDRDHEGCLDSLKKIAEMSKTASSDCGPAKAIVGNIPPLDFVTKPLIKKDCNMVKDSSAFPSLKKCRKNILDMDSTKRIQEINPQNQIGHSLESKNIMHDSRKDRALDQIYSTENHRNQNVDPQPSNPMGQITKIQDLSNRPTKRVREIKSATKLKSGRDQQISKKLKVSFDKCKIATNAFQCAFCHSAEDTEASGDMVHYFNGKPVAADNVGGSNIVHSHENCTEWAPNVYFEDDLVINLTAEISRSGRMTCRCCGIKGAALGCYEKSCQKTFHVPCAKLMPECRWDTKNFVMLCPLHATSKLPSELPDHKENVKSNALQKGITLEKVSSEHHDQKRESSSNEIPSWQWSSYGLPNKIILCCSALTIAEKEIVTEFKKLSGATELKKWSPNVTRVIASTNEDGAYRRTLKFCMGILEGKWILSVDWIKACMNALKPVDEKQFEISLDVHGVTDGPRLGRLRVINKEPKLFHGLEFYFAGDFLPSYKGYLKDSVTAAGGIVLQRKPASVDMDGMLSELSRNPTFIIYNLEMAGKLKPGKQNQILKCQKSDAQALANSFRAKLASNSWILNSVAACKLQNMDE